MKEYKREYPFFSLCGLNCGLCPRYHTKGLSKCPGCGGKDFYSIHPSCSVITCNQKKDNVEFCYQCSSFPCERYAKPKNSDSFISYKNVISDFEKAKMDLEEYKKQLNEKMDILEYLINSFDDGRRKNFYCVAVNLLELDDLRDVIKDINDKVGKQDIPQKNKIEQVVSLFEARADQLGIKLKLRK